MKNPEHCLSSEEGCIDLDLELSSNESISSLSSTHQRETELEQNIRELNIIGDLECGNSDDYKPQVVGRITVGSTTQMKQIPSAWVTNAKRFSARIDGAGIPIDEMANLRQPFLPVLRKFTKCWFPVQQAVLPCLLNSSSSGLPARDLVICSPTGSGKTLCYLLPILNALGTAKSFSSIFALIIVPMKNLVQQIMQEFERLNVFGIKIVALIGQNDYLTERKNLMQDGTKRCNAHIIVSTPGRFVEHLLDTDGIIDLSMLRYLVIDEADRMQDTARMEWLELVEKYANVPRANVLNIASLTDCSKNNWLQRILVSATLSIDVDKLHTWNLRCPLLFQAEKQTNGINGQSEQQQQQQINDPELSLILPHSLVHKLIVCKPNIKPLLLYQHIESHVEWRRIIVFVNKKQTGKRLSILLSSISRKKFLIAEFSANLYKSRRQKQLRDLQNGKIRVLVACDMLSRGIDVLDVDCVVNYDVPINERIFIHRAGRTARAMKEGMLLSFTTKEERLKLKKLLAKRDLWSGIEERKMDNSDLDDKLMRRYDKALASLKSKVKQEK